MRHNFWSAVQITAFFLAVAALAISLSINAGKSSTTTPLAYPQVSYTTMEPTPTETPTDATPDARVPIVPFTPLPAWQLNLNPGFNLTVWPGDTTPPSAIYCRFPEITAIIDPNTGNPPSSLETNATYWFVASANVTITP